MKKLLIGLLAFGAISAFAQSDADRSSDLLDRVGRKTFTLKVIQPIELSAGQTSINLGNHCRMSFKWSSDPREVDIDRILSVHVAGIETNAKKNSIVYVLSVDDPNKNLLTISCYGLKLSNDFTVEQFSSEISEYLEIEKLPKRTNL